MRNILSVSRDLICAQISCLCIYLYKYSVYSADATVHVHRNVCRSTIIFIIYSLIKAVLSCISPLYTYYCTVL